MQPYHLAVAYLSLRLLQIAESSAADTAVVLPAARLWSSVAVLRRALREQVSSAVPIY
jgi:hypothetical protein